MAERIYLQQSSRGTEFCPLCNASIVWRSTGYRKWTACDSIPVLFAYGGDQRVVYRGEIQGGVSILTTQNAARFVGKQMFYALEPHVFTCSGIEHLTAFRGYEDRRKEEI